MTHAESPCLGKHWPGCVEPRTQRRLNSIGAVWVTCRGCGAYWQDPDGWSDIPPTAAENRTPVEIVAPPSSVTGWVCREHLDCPVTPRGRGCPTCAADLKKRRKATSPSDYEMETYR